MPLSPLSRGRTRKYGVAILEDRQEILGLLSGSSRLECLLAARFARY
jgi:hypothetical protein